jgi:hypothetical protein
MVYADWPYAIEDPRLTHGSLAIEHVVPVQQ